jgi:protein TonB
MFDDFSKDETSPDAKKRLRGSIVGATLVYVVAAGALVAATATARQVVEEQLTQVEFAPPPEPEPEPEPPKIEEAPKPTVSPRPKMKRAAIQPPKEIPLEKPKESDAELAAAGDTGPVDGFLDGVEGGTGSGRVAPPPPPPPPPPKPGKVTGPVELDNPQPKYPKSAERKGIEGVVVVSFEVLEDGRCTSAKIVSGPEEFHETVLKAVATWRYRPAMQDGKKIRKRTTKRVVFQLT